MKKTRKAVWRECPWCKARGMEPFRSGKLKCFTRHVVKCQAEYLLEQKTGERPQIEVLTAMVNRQQCQIADLVARITVLETRKRRPIDPTNYWNSISPKTCWQNRKRNAKRFIRAILSTYEGPQKYYSDIWGFWEWFFPREVDIQDILMLALWPIVEDRDNQPVLRDIQTTDHYFMFKQIWGKSKTDGTDLVWFIEAMQEVGVPSTAYDAYAIRKNGVEFDRALRKFQLTKKRASGPGLAQGLIALGRIWRKMYACDVEHVTAAMSLPPTEELKWETARLLDQPSLE